mgnify:CR=1 FL=1
MTLSRSQRRSWYRHGAADLNRTIDAAKAAIAADEAAKQERLRAAEMAASFGIAVLIGRLAVGFLVDYFWGPLVAAVFLLPAVKPSSSSSRTTTAARSLAPAASTSSRSGTSSATA